MVDVLDGGGLSGLEIALVVLFAVLFAGVSFGFWTVLAGLGVKLRGGDRFDLGRADGSDSGDAAADRRGDADLPRGRGPRLRGAARGLPLARADRSRAGLPLLRALRLPRPGRVAARRAGVVRLLPRSERLRPDLLSAPAARDQSQERRHRGFLSALGPRLPLPDRARRRQPDDGRDAGPAGGADGGASARRHPPDACPPPSARARCTRASSSSRNVSTARSTRRASTTGSSPRRATGATTRSCAWRRSWSTARCRGSPGAGRSRARCSRTTSSRPPGCGARATRSGSPRGSTGSFEELPPTLLDSLKRDRRWCQGNLQHARLLAEPGLHGVQRLNLLLGIVAYAMAPLWLAFLVLSTLSAAQVGRRRPHAADARIALPPRARRAAHADRARALPADRLPAARAEADRVGLRARGRASGAAASAARRDSRRACCSRRSTPPAWRRS